MQSNGYCALLFDKSEENKYLAQFQAADKKCLEVFLVYSVLVRRQEMHMKKGSLISVSVSSKEYVVRL